MTTAVAVQPQPGHSITDEQIRLIKATVCQGITDAELSLFIHQCEKTGLDPLSRQIHAIKRDGKLCIQTGIDGFRLIADRTGCYVGNDEPAFIEGEHLPFKATVTVWKLVSGMRCPFTASALWNEYYPGDKSGFMWRKMPHVMLGKVAEALALRKAFPQELSGLYTSEEMAQAGEVIDAESRNVKPQQALPAPRPTNGHAEAPATPAAARTTKPAGEESQFPNERMDLLTQIKGEREKLFAARNLKNEQEQKTFWAGIMINFGAERPQQLDTPKLKGLLAEVKHLQEDKPPVSPWEQEERRKRTAAQSEPVSEYHQAIEERGGH